jgi:hypothetical protein
MLRVEYFRLYVILLLHVDGYTEIHLLTVYSIHRNACMTFPLETLPPGDPIGGVVYLRIILSPEEASRIYDISFFGKRPFIYLYTR